MKLMKFTINLLNSFISVIKIILKSKYNVKYYKTKNKNCIVLANGPSLNKNIEEHKELFHKNELITVNFFTQSPHFFELKPKNHIILDGSFFNNNNNSKFIDFNKTIRDKVDWEMNFHIPTFAKNSKLVKEYLKKNSNITIQYYNYTTYKGFDKLGYFLFKKNVCMIQSQNIVVSALFNAIQFGFKYIYLFGAENSWHADIKVNQNNQLIYNDTHLYNQNEDTLNIIPGKLHEQMNSLYKLFIGYHNIQNYAKYKGCNIYNCSSNSYIDAFPRLNKEEFEQKLN